jgi:hypothetical protein
MGNRFNLYFGSGLICVGGFMELVKFFGDNMIDIFEGFIYFFEGNFSVNSAFLVTGLDSL